MRLLPAIVVATHRDTGDVAPLPFGPHQGFHAVARCPRPYSAQLPIATRWDMVYALTAVHTDRTRYRTLSTQRLPVVGRPTVVRRIRTGSGH